MATRAEIKVFNENDPNISLFLTQSYHMALEVLALTQCSTLLSDLLLNSLTRLLEC